MWKRIAAPAVLAAVTFVGVAAGVSGAAPAGTHHHIVRLHQRIDRLHARLEAVRARNAHLRSELAVARRGTILRTIDTATVTYHMPATEAPDGKWQCAEVTNTNRGRVAAITIPFASLIRSSTSIVVNHADGSTLTYVYDEAQAPYNPCSDPYAASN